MPFALVGKLRWSGKDYELSIEELHRIIPHVKDGDLLTFIIFEIKNEHDELVMRPKPLTRTCKKVVSRYLKFSVDEASELNIGNNYKLTILITEHNNKPLLPFELKCGRSVPKEIEKSLKRIETNLLSITQPELQQTVNYLLNANVLYENGYIEDARTSLRRSIEALSKIRDKIKPVKGREDEDFGKRLENLIKSVKSFVDYGGPHLGPAPKPTTEMVLNIIVEIVKMLSNNIAEGNITLISETSPV
jgi:hypothetical protein